MQTDTERVLRNLSILSNLSQNDKINTNGDIFVIYEPTYIRGIYRLWYGEGRQYNIQRIQEIVRIATATIRQDIQDVKTMNTEEQVFQKETKKRHYARLIETLAKSRTGLTNLQQTYKDDVSSSSQVQIIIDEINDFLQIINSPAVVASPPPISPVNAFILNN